MQKPLSFATPPQRILLILPTWVGDVVMATPFIKAITQHFAQARVSLLMYRHLHPVLQGAVYADDCYFWAGRDKADKPARQALVQQLRAEHFDLAILLPNSLRVARFARQIRAKRRVGYNRDGRRLWLTDPLPVPNRRGRQFEPMPLVDYYAKLASYLGCDGLDDQLELQTTPADEQATRSRLQQAGVAADARLVTLCPGANFGASKCWHPERFAAVADRLVEQHGATIAISPGPGEEPLASAIAQHMRHPAVLLQAPCLTLGELKSLIKASVLLLGNDTGPRHFARAFDVPRVTVFGPTEARWTDTSHDKETIVRVQVPCGPCHQKVCPLPERICMDRVSVDMVTDACNTQLQL